MLLSKIFLPLITQEKNEIIVLSRLRAQFDLRIADGLAVAREHHGVGRTLHGALINIGRALVLPASVVATDGVEAVKEFGGSYGVHGEHGSERATGNRFLIGSNAGRVGHKRGFLQNAVFGKRHTRDGLQVDGHDGVVVQRCKDALGHTVGIRRRGIGGKMARSERAQEGDIEQFSHFFSFFSSFFILRSALV